MRAPFYAKPDLAKVNAVSAHYGSWFRDRMALALRAAMDGDRQKRLSALECPWCFYEATGRLGGAAMTTWACAECTKEQVAGSTATPKLCAECAHDLELCRECCADLDFRHRRSLHRMRAGDRIFSKRGKRLAFSWNPEASATADLVIPGLEPIRLRPSESAYDLASRIRIALKRAESEVR